MRLGFLVGMLAVLAGAAQAEDAALFAGIERYANLEHVEDATDLTQNVGNFQQRGYAVQFTVNGGKRELQLAAQEWLRDASDAERLIVGLAGRVVTDGTRHWLLGADAGELNYFGAGFDGLSLESVMEVLRRRDGSLFVLGVDPDFDARYGGLLRDGLGTLEVPEGVTVVRGSPAAVARLVRQIARRPGFDVIEEVRRTSSLSFVGDTPRRLIMIDDADGARRAEDRAWNEARDSDRPQPYLDYLERYPRGRYASAARDRLEALRNDPIRQAEAAEERLGLDRGARRQLQSALTALGYNTRGVDGIFGNGTRSAIRAWQEEEGFEVTGFLTADQVGRLEAQGARRQAELEAEAAAERELQEARDRAFWSETGARGTESDLRLYLDRFPNGLFADQARDQLEDITGSRAREQEQREDQGRAQAQAQEDAMRLSPVVRRLVESRLQDLGARPGRVDGVFDADTRRAIARYQAARDLPRTGYLNQVTVARLLADTLNSMTRP